MSILRKPLPGVSVLAARRNPRVSRSPLVEPNQHYELCLPDVTPRDTSASTIQAVNRESASRKRGRFGGDHTSGNQYDSAA